jgi:peptide/nickel transport system permease protein
VLLGGAVLVETCSTSPASGGWPTRSIINADFPMIQGTVLLAAMFIVI